MSPRITGALLNNNNPCLAAWPSTAQAPVYGRLNKPNKESLLNGLGEVSNEALRTRRRGDAGRG